MKINIYGLGYVGSVSAACLAADGDLLEGEDWIQESVIGSRFSGQFRWLDRDKGHIEPTIRGTAHITAETTLLFDQNDPFCWGLSPNATHCTPGNSPTALSPS